MAYMYHPDIAAKAVVELKHAFLNFRDQEYANALLADHRMTNTKGVLASCGFSYRDIKVIRDQVSKHLPTLETQRYAIAFLDEIDRLQREKQG